MLAVAALRAGRWTTARALWSERIHRGPATAWGWSCFAEALSGYPLRRQWGLQALCYGPGDYAGPHNDHHPDEPLGRDGYTDLHLTFCLEGVEAQWLVYERQGHFSEVAPVATVGGVTCYRLPFWHYTTPLTARPGKAGRCRRWVLLGTFLDRWGRAPRG